MIAHRLENIKYLVFFPTSLIIKHKRVFNKACWSVFQYSKYE